MNQGLRQEHAECTSEGSFKFVDPRLSPDPVADRPPRRTTADPQDLDGLHQFCREGRLYEVEHWIQAGRPLQLTEESLSTRRRWNSALEIALKAENHALVFLLLCNGYDPNQERFCPLDVALRARRWDLLDLLLAWGADPNDVDLEELFGTYNAGLWERFRSLGVDLTADHSLSSTLAQHTSNKPLFGFARRHREHDPRIQGELNGALAHHVERANEKGVLLCLWAGADPHAPARGVGDSDENEEMGETDSSFWGFSAIGVACLHGHAGILQRLGPDPTYDNFERLYQIARSSAVIEYLVGLSPPRDITSLIQAQLWPLTIGLESWRSEWRTLDTLRTIFRTGARWVEGSVDGIAGVRRQLLKLSDAAFVEVLRLLAEADHSSPEILQELGRTRSMRSRMQKVGFLPPSPGEATRARRVRPSRSREVLKKFGVELPRETPSLPRHVQIGPWRRGGQEIRMDRHGLFDHVWSEPVTKLANRWGISGRGLARACRRLQIPVPPRGYWARVEAGQRVRRPALPHLSPGEAEEVVIWIPALPPTG